MEKDRINFLLSHPTQATLEDIALIEREIIRYPYSQMLHILLAKIGFHLKTEDKQKKLTSAAIYSSDRSILKKVITEDQYLESVPEIAPFQEIPEFAAGKSKKELEGQPEQDEDSASIFDEVLKNLQKLKTLRKQFQFLEQKNDLIDSEATPEIDLPESRSDTEVKTEIEKAAKPAVDIEPTSKRIKEKKKKLDDILEKDEAIDTQVNAFFLNEIEKKKPTPKEIASERHAVQKQIIEQFIEDQPSIGPIRREDTRSSDEINRDLSEKSTKFTDDLVSENLAIILLRQGKKERAIDIYRKLIWKLPQKKAYFAARIKEIKN